MIIFNDAIDISKPVPLSRDIILQFWRIAGEGRGPNIDCSFEKFLKAGFKVINSYYPETYADTELKTEKLVKWNPKNSPECEESLKKNILGGEMCAWGRMPHFE